MNNGPNTVKKKIKDNAEYKKGQEKEEKLNAAKSQIKAKNLKLDWCHIADVIIAIAIVIAATATVFFPGQDVGAS